MNKPISSLIKQEHQRQINKIGLIPSENHASPEVREALASTLSSKYSEGYPGRRYYEGNQIIDQIESEAIDRIKQLFDVPHANVQPYSGSPANAAIYFALLEQGETLMGLSLAGGGHLTHGHPKVTFSGKYFNTVQYGLNDEARIDFEQMARLAKKHQPQVIVAGNTAYPFELDFRKFRQIADEVGAWLVADISHITGLVISGDHLSPIPYADVVMSTTHKTFRGPRGAMILVTKQGLERDNKLGQRIDKAVFPGMQGGPHNETVAAIAIAAKEASTDQFQEYGHQIRKNADRLAKSLTEQGIKLVGDGTDSHLMLIDLTKQGFGLGSQVAYALDQAGIYANKNTIPGEPSSAFYPSGVRIGTPLVTTRGMKESQMDQIGAWIAEVVNLVSDSSLPQTKKQRRQFIKEFKEEIKNNDRIKSIYQEVKQMTQDYPLFASEWRLNE
jgi:glycine hydroxymethyltransferase